MLLNFPSSLSTGRRMQTTARSQDKRNPHLCTNASLKALEEQVFSPSLGGPGAAGSVGAMLRAGKPFSPALLQNSR